MFNQLNLFGDQEIKVTKKEEGVKQQEKANEKKNSTAAKGAKGTTSTPKTSKKPEIKVFTDWTIHYYGNTFSVTEFVPEIPEEGITTEALREAMVLEFYEMEKDRSSFDYDAENKRLFPKVTGGAKG